MKKILLFACAFTSLNGFAQETRFPANGLDNVQNLSTKIYDTPSPSAKTSATGDTLTIATNEQRNGTFTNLVYDFVAPFDSGRLYGTNIVGWKGFAQLYDLGFDMTAPIDTTISIIGVVSRWAGTVQTTSTKNVVFSVWKRGTTKTAIPNMTKWFVYGHPVATPDVTKSVPVTGLNINTGTVATYFTTPLSNINHDVYVGYTMSYTWGSLGGDTLGLRSTTVAGTNYYTIEAGTNDTLLSANNLVQESTGGWKSTRFDIGVGNAGDQVIYPIVKMTCPTCFPSSINGVKRNNLTFFGNYPNPATNNTNIKLSLKNSVNVNIRIMEINGRLINIISNNLNSGENIVSIETRGLVAGTYLYTIETSEGDGIASQFTVSR